MENHGIVALLMLLFYRVEQSYPVIVLLRLLDPFSCCSMGYSYQSVRFFQESLLFHFYFSLPDKGSFRWLWCFRGVFCELKYMAR